MGPESAKSYPGQGVVRVEATDTEPAGRAKQEIDYGRRGHAGYVFGALKPADGEVFTATYTGRTIGNWSDFLRAGGNVASSRGGARICDPRQSQCSSGLGCAALQSGASTVGSRLSTQIRGLFELD